ncbi:MAG: hypothetical protein EBV07_01415 [Proteobacteria bacterium]|nr:hypothetical protein [Pseudomonadota bacterium]
MSSNKNETQLEPQVVYMNDIHGNHYKLEVTEGNIIFGATFLVFQKIDNSWVSLGERVSNSGIKKGRQLWGLIEVDSYYIYMLI